MPDCPCCSGKLLQHVRQRELVWFCLTCRQDMPLLTPKLQTVAHHLNSESR